MDEHRRAKTSSSGAKKKSKSKHKTSYLFHWLFSAGRSSTSYCTTPAGEYVGTLSPLYVEAQYIITNLPNCLLYLRT